MERHVQKDVYKIPLTVYDMLANNGYYRKNRTMQPTYIYMLHAKRTDIKHDFVELFSSMDQLEGWLFNHPNIIKCEITLHEVNPD